MFSFDGDPVVKTDTCPTCSQEHQNVTGFVLRDGGAYAIYSARWSPHASEAYVDVVLGTWADDDEDDEHTEDHVTFACRLGPVAGQEGPAASLVQAGPSLSDKPVWGRKLSREEALAQPRLTDFWEVVDWLVVNDPVLHPTIYHA